jgi:hypothetical protein
MLGFPLVGLRSKTSLAGSRFDEIEAATQKIADDMKRLREEIVVTHGVAA